MELKWKLHKFTFKPADYTATEPRAVMGVKRGTLVANVALRIGEQFNGVTDTIAIGDGTDPNGFMTTAQAACTVAGLKNGAGEYLATLDSDAGGNTPGAGRLYTADDTIDLVFTAAGDGTTGLATVYIIYAETE